MLRGINKQDIFFDDEDYQLFMRILSDAPHQRQADGKIIRDKFCEIYAFAILPNHIHILIRERETSISDLMKSIEDRFVIIYNKKYERVGHLFQARFKSEPVNDREYFYTLLRYIHRNPVKAMLCDRPEDYPYSSWREYVPGAIALQPICKTSVPLHYFPYPELQEWVNTDKDDECMDMNSEIRINSDSQAATILCEISQSATIEEFKQLSMDHQMHYIRQAIDRGISIRKCSRLSTLSYQMIRSRLEKFAENATKVSDPLVANLAERQRQVLDIIRHDNTLTVKDIAELLHVSIDTIYRDVKSINKITRLFFDRKTKQWYMTPVQ